MSSKKKLGIIVIIIAVLAAVLGIGMVVTTQVRNNKMQENLDMGAKYLDELDYDKALVAFQAVLEIEPKSVEAYLGIVEAYIGKGDYASALSQAQTGYEITADERLKEKVEEVEEIIFIEDALKKGEEALKKPDYQVALEAFKEVLKVDAGNERALKGIIEAYLGRIKELLAAEDYEAVLNLAKEAYELTGDQRFADIVTVEEKIKLGQESIKLAAYKEALGSFKEVQKLEKENKRAQNGVIDAYLGMVNELMEASDYEEALSLAKEAYDETKDSRFQDIITFIENGPLKCKIQGHEWKEANYQQPKTCAVCGVTEGELLQPSFVRKGLTPNMEVGVEYEYKTDGGSGTVKLAEYKTFKSDATHPAKEGYVWRSAKLVYTYDLNKLTANSQGRKDIPAIESINDYYITNVQNRKRLSGAGLVTSVNLNENGAYSEFSYTVNYLGEDVECYEVYVFNPQMVDPIVTMERTHEVLVPEGYDGSLLIVFSPASSSTENDRLYFRMN